IGARHGHIARNTPASGTLREPDSRHEPIRPHAGVRLPPGCLTPMARAGQFLDLSTSLLAAIQGIMARSLPPTCSICDSALMRRREMSVGAPAAFSRMKFLAYSPVWMSVRHLRMAFLVSSVTMVGPVTYSPYSALFEME